MSEEQKKQEAAVAEASAQAAEKPETQKAEAQKSEAQKPSQPTAADLLSSDVGEIKIRKAKGSKNVHSGVCHINATFNNTKVSFTDAKGNVISWSSAGKMNFRGSRKSTAYAAQVVTQDAGKIAMSHGMKEVAVNVKGPGMGRDSAIRSLQALGFSVTAIVDVTPVPHNGCRAPKRRRV
ncbi:MAG: 30S ribosomal protein S11 [Verrucomicrobia bacterium]|nr:MAG: 30S ribosomal protein S11 [Verrucomicrobiota bacterium]